MSQSVDQPNHLDVTAGADPLREEVLAVYGNRVRVRVCGLYRRDDSLLMVRHRGVGPTETFWSPPGGGLEFGELAPQALIREFAEETGLAVDIGELLFVHEFLKPPLHAMELFFEVQTANGSIRRGIDPEAGLSDQIIEDVRFMSFNEIKNYPPHAMHALFHRCRSLDDVFRLRGYLC